MIILIKSEPTNPIFMPPFEKGGILSVGRSVGMSLNVLSAQYLLTPSLDQYQTWYRGCPQSVDDPVDYQVTCSKVKVKPIFSANCVVRSISFDPFTWSISNLVQGLPSISRWSFLIIRSHVQRSRSNRTNLLCLLCCPLNIFWPLHLINTKLGAGVALNK